MNLTYTGFYSIDYVQFYTNIWVVAKLKPFSNTEFCGLVSFYTILFASWTNTEEQYKLFLNIFVAFIIFVALFF